MPHLVLSHEGTKWEALGKGWRLLLFFIESKLKENIFVKKGRYQTIEYHYAYRRVILCAFSSNLTSKFLYVNNNKILKNYEYVI